MRRDLILVALAVLGLLGACSDEERVDAGGGAPSGQRYEANATVLESPAHGPQLCLGAIATSLPPQCGGPDIVGWGWDAVEGEEAANGTTWGSYRVVGTYTGGVFTLTEPAVAPDPSLGDDGFSVDFTSPCPAPAGGWAVVDVATATEAGQQAANEYAVAQADYAGSWVDQSINPALADGFDPGDEEVANDPTKLVLNVRFTGDLERHTEELRARWGGPLCVTAAEHTSSELEAIQAELSVEPGMLESSTDVVTNQVFVRVIIDDGVQQRLDAQYGKGVVRVTSALRPVS
ncbi:MAG: hypothetical protein ACOYXM_06930 [Actinomycetota bacterium]